MPSRKGRKGEKQVAKKTRGRRTPASGAGAIKSDVFAQLPAGWLGRFAIQVKYTDKQSFTLKLSDLDKAIEEAIQEGREPLFCIVFKNRRFWVCPEYVISSILEE